VKRRYVSFLVGVCAALVWVERSRADCNDPFGKPNELLDFHFQMSRADWNALVANRPGEACNAVYRDFKVQFRCGTEGPWMKAALRKKRGEQRGIEAPQKPPLKLDFNETFMNTVPEAMGQSWPPSFGRNGYRKLTLNNGQGNRYMNMVIPLPNLMAEHVAMRLLKREVPATPGAAYAKVTIHTEDKPDGEYHGVYLLFEDIDKAALRRRFGTDIGKLVKNSKDACNPQVEYDDGAPNAATAAWNAWFSGAASSTVEQASKAMDLDAYLRQEAIREILVNGDDTIATSVSNGGMGLNWYYFDPREGLRHFIPWDTDLTFGQQNENCAPNSLKCLPTERVGRWCANPSGLGRVTVCQNQIRRRYLEIMCQLINGSMSAAEILKVWEEAYQTVKDVVPLEKDLIWNGRDPTDPNIFKSFGQEYGRLKAWIPQRINSVRSQIQCPQGCTEGQSEACMHLTCPGERRCQGGAWTPCRPSVSCAAGTPTMTADGGVTAGDGGVSSADAGSSSGAGGAGGSSGGGTGGGTAGSTGGSAGAGGAPPAMGGMMAGAGGAAGGSPPRPPSGGSAGSGPSTPDPGMPEAGGCQCRTGAASAAAPSGWFLLGAALLYRRIRRRARTASGAARTGCVGPTFT
jgi:MYXO-CTERM domain-containing protein